MNFSTVVRRLVFVWRAKKIWHMPRQVKTLIYDRCGSENLLEYINEKNVEILDVGGESINVYVLLKCVFSLK
ncbi:MAG TPA: hypothetical protein VJ044_03760, partial [Candidatus Hodarchaeales archaeon]|nr:hypothetical protein [Candidatus Hodarchaeales archaeon]